MYNIISLYELEIKTKRNILIEEVINMLFNGDIIEFSMDIFPMTSKFYWTDNITRLEEDKKWNKKITLLFSNEKSEWKEKNFKTKEDYISYIYWLNPELEFWTTVDLLLENSVYDLANTDNINEMNSFRVFLKKWLKRLSEWKIIELWIRDLEDEEYQDKIAIIYTEENKKWFSLEIPLDSIYTEQTIDDIIDDLLVYHWIIK